MGYNWRFYGYNPHCWPDGSIGVIRYLLRECVQQSCGTQGQPNPKYVRLNKTVNNTK